MVVLLILAFSQTVSAKYSAGIGVSRQQAVERVSVRIGNIEAGGVQGDSNGEAPISPAALFGLSVSIIGMLVFGVSAIAFSKRKA